MSTIEDAKTFIRADEVVVGDVLCFGNPKLEVHVERLTTAEGDGACGLHGNNDTWSSWYAPHHRVRIKCRSEQQAIQADLHMNHLKTSGALLRNEISRAHAIELQHGDHE